VQTRSDFNNQEGRKIELKKRLGARHGRVMHATTAECPGEGGKQERSREEMTEGGQRKD